MEHKRFILELIELYSSLPALWKVKSKEYNDRAIKNAQYEILLAKYKEKYPDADKSELKKKLNNIRTNYRRELRRITLLENTGVVISEENESNLYYFDALSFLRENVTPASYRSTIDVNVNGTEGGRRQIKRRVSDEDLGTPATKCLEQPEDEYAKDDNEQINRRIADTELIVPAAKCLEQTQDECAKVGEIWATKLMKMDDTQRILAEKFVNQILFEGQMGSTLCFVKKFVLTFSSKLDRISSIFENEIVNGE